MDAVSCEFFRGNCAHAEIFGSEYKRTNRTKRTKILRCFPHCCPEHVNRSYCGAPVRVRVRFPIERSGREFGRSWTRSHSDVLLFAHFEEAQTDELRVGSELALDAVLAAVQTEQTPKGVWIEGALQHSDLEQNEHVYQINPGARWYYEWESAATKAQRFTKHVLRVYVFERAQAPDRAAPRTLRVVALATSPEFLVVSYRRAPTAEGRAEARVEGQTEGRAGRRDTPLLPSPEWAPPDSSSDHHHHHHHKNNCPSPREAVRAAAFDAVRTEHKAWAAQHEAAMLASKRLAILYHFMMSVDALPFHSSMRQWSALLFDQLEGAPSSQKLEAFLQPSAGAEETDMDPTAHVVRVCAGILGWLVFDKATVDQMRRLTTESVAGLLDKRVLRSGYVKAVEFLSDRVEQFAGSSFASPASESPASALALVTEQIMTVVFQNELFSHLRPVFIGVLSTPAMFGFQVFVAQVRAMFVSTALPKLAATIGHERQQATPFNGTWDLDGNRSSVKSTAKGTAGFSLGCAMHFLREWAQVSLRVTSEQSITVASSWTLLSGVGQGRALPAAMHLTLDGRRRVFQNFPSGLSSMIPMGSQLLGEYRGQIESASSFWVEFASTDEANTDGLRWILQFQAEDVEEAIGRRTSLLLIQGSIESLQQLEADATQAKSEQFQLSLTFNRSSA